MNELRAMVEAAKAKEDLALAMFTVQVLSLMMVSSAIDQARTELGEGASDDEVAELAGLVTEKRYRAAEEQALAGGKKSDLHVRVMTAWARRMTEKT